MLLGYIWVLFVAASLICGIFTGSLETVGAAALDGAAEAVKLVAGLCGALCLWNGVLEVLHVTGIDRGLARAFRPLLRRLLPDAAENDEALGAAAANISANLLGLGNAATPTGIKAAKLMADGCARAGNSLCAFVVLNTASIQLIPATVAALRSSLGSASAFDILPAVWCSSLCALAAGLAAERLMRHFTQEKTL